MQRPATFVVDQDKVIGEERKQLHAESRQSELIHCTEVARDVKELTGDGPRQEYY